MLAALYPYGVNLVDLPDTEVPTGGDGNKCMSLPRVRFYHSLDPNDDLESALQEPQICVSH